MVENFVQCHIMLILLINNKYYIKDYAEFDRDWISLVLVQYFILKYVVPQQVIILFKDIITNTDKVISGTYIWIVLS